MSRCEQRMDCFHQRAQGKPGRGCDYDGGGWFFHRKRCPGNHPAENGTLIQIKLLSPGTFFFILEKFWVIFYHLCLK